MNRRNVIKGLTILPFAGSLFPSVLAAPAEKGFELAGSKVPATPAGLPLEPNIFRSIGVEPIINCRGTFTIIGGSIERPEVRAAMEAASKDFVQYDELADGIGQRLAEITGAEWGMVSAGCAAAMKHVTAACVTGGNPEKLIRIPDLAGFEKTGITKKEWKMWEDRITVIDNAVKTINGVITERIVPPVANHNPALNILWDSNKVNITRTDLQENLRNGHPSIEVMDGENNSIRITVFMLKRGQDKIVGRRVKEELSKASV